jgi:hypothetical protein
MIFNPMNPGDPVYDMAFNLYAMEEEGLLMTNKGIMNNVANLIQEGYTFEDACEKAGVDWDLTPDDLDYIEGRL